MRLLRSEHAQQYFLTNVTHHGNGTENVDALFRKEIDNDAKRQPKVGQSKPRKDQGNDVVLRGPSIEIAGNIV